jgi:hypothetical protein
MDNDVTDDVVVTVLPHRSAPGGSSTTTLSLVASAMFGRWLILAFAAEICGEQHVSMISFFFALLLRV